MWFRVASFNLSHNTSKTDICEKKQWWVSNSDINIGAELKKNSTSLLRLLQFTVFLWLKWSLYSSNILYSCKNVIIPELWHPSSVVLNPNTNVTALYPIREYCCVKSNALIYTTLFTVQLHTSKVWLIVNIIAVSSVLKMKLQLKNKWLPWNQITCTKNVTVLFFFKCATFYMKFNLLYYVLFLHNLINNMYIVDKVAN